MAKSILIVDDDADVRLSLKNICEHERLDVVIAENGVECLECLEKGFSGILLIDLTMPRMDGWETIKEIVKRGLEKNINIIVYTASGTSHHHKMKGLEPYIYDYVTKPFDFKELMENIKKIK
jgi:DNA-binding response OmpR family regulator